MGILKWLANSSGFKRRLASLLAVLYGLVGVFPQLQPLVTILEQLAAAIGGVGVVHAVTAKSLSRAKLAGISSVLSVLVVLCAYFPALAPYKPLLEKLATILGAMGISVGFGTNTTEQKV